MNGEGVPAGAQAPTPAWRLYRAMVGVGLACGVLIVLAFELTAPIIAKKRAAALVAAIFEVLPGGVEHRTFVLSEGADSERFVPLPEEGAVDATAPRVHVAYDDRGAVVGLAVEATTMGYQDTVQLLYGYSPRQKKIVGLHVLESRETPGLGDKISSDPEFQSNFEALDVSLGAEGTIQNPIEAVPHGEKSEPWQIDGITGATISSQAVARALRESTEWWIPRLDPRLSELELAGTADAKRSSAIDEGEE